MLRRRDVVAAGAPTTLLRTMVRRGDRQPLLRGSVVVDPWRGEAGMRRSWARSAVLTVDGAVVGLGTAAALHGLAGAPRGPRVHVVVPRAVSPGGRPLVVHQYRLRADHVVHDGGIPLTSAERPLADLVPTRDRLDALAVLDSYLRRGGRREGLRRVEGGVPPDDLQHEIRDEHGHLLARADMIFRRRRRRPGLLVLEADGQDPHGGPEARHRDRWRANALVALGHDVIRCTWRDTLSRWAIPTMVRAAL